MLAQRSASNIGVGLASEIALLSIYQFSFNLAFNRITIAYIELFSSGCEFL